MGGKMIWFAASEAVPFAKSGGLGDVMGALPQALAGLGHDVRVLLPNYERISQAYRDEMRTIAEFRVRLGWRFQYCGIQALVRNGIRYYFLDNEYYFKRGGLYGYGDDAERFVFFSRAGLEAMIQLDEAPDLLHCHDWQSALMPFLLKTQYHEHRLLSKVSTVLTIHNLKYQGVFSKEVLMDLLGMGPDVFIPDGIEFYGAGNCLKAGIGYADAITTVSPAYAEEICMPYYGEKLDGLLNKRKPVLSGIVNGIDTKIYDPSTDPCLHANFSNPDTLDFKYQHKVKLQEEIGLCPDRDIPLIALISRLVEQKGIDLIDAVLPSLMAHDLQLVVMGTGEWHYEQMLRQAADRWPEKFRALILFDEDLARKLYAASDMFLMPSRFEPCGISQLLALRYLSVPVVRETGGLKDTVRSYNEVDGTGNGFSFTPYNAHDMLHTVERALRFYREKASWMRILSNAAASELGWETSARKYEEVYEQVLARRE